ncbi:MAG TPA: L,D-transpeptidase family protein [Cytophagaceae bacterium]
MRSTSVVILLLVLLACGKKDTSVDDNKENSGKTVLSFFTKPEAEYIDSIRIDSFFIKYPEFTTYKNKLKKFYSRRNYELAWSHKGEFLPQADMLINLIQYADLEGIDSCFTSSKYIREQLLTAKTTTIKSPKAKGLRQELDLLLSANYFKYASNIWKGKVYPQAQNLEWYVEMKKIKYGKTLDSILSAHHEINPFTLYEPLHEHYKKLKKELIRYKLIEEAGGWPELKPSKNILQSGDTVSEVKQLKRNLYIMGDYKGDTSSTVFSNELKNAVKQFQKRHGLNPDGVVNEKTLEALNIPVSSRIEQIIINMERWRWIPQQLPENYLLVNIPDYKLKIIEHGKTVDEMRVIVGDKATLTPVFNDEIEYIVFNPYWHIPESIALEEIAPRLNEDENYLISEGIEIFPKDNSDSLIDPATITWDSVTVDTFPYYFKQKPGPKNPLGRVKFIFPNAFSVYLHDTPGQHLFDEKQRGFSHGCIRVEAAIKLAQYLLSENEDWNRKKIESVLKSEKEKSIRLSKKMPVYIVYFTSWTDENGLLNFRNDIYQHDTKLSRIFFEK